MAKPIILIVEDDPDIRDLEMQILEEERVFDVAGVPDGRRGLQFLRAHPETALILLDLMLPIMSGTEVRLAQLADPTIAGIPVVVVTAYAVELLDLQRLRACRYLSKPHHIDRLLGAVYACRRKDTAAA